MKFVFFVLMIVWIAACSRADGRRSGKRPQQPVGAVAAQPKTVGGLRPPDKRVIHVLVALCDNKYQGIVPVPALMGNGQEPDKNLYWGAAFGVRTFFRKSREWVLTEEIKNAEANVLERLVFTHRTKNYFLVADAYDGQYIRQTTVDFINSAAGIKKEVLIINADTIGLYGNGGLITYIGHDGLMDFTLSGKFEHADNNFRKTIILACYSKRFFSPFIKQAGAVPLLWSTGLMAPEAYILHAALSAYTSGAPDDTIREQAAAAYSKYQKCTGKAARNLLVTGW